jgi:hypothetical protein
VKADGEAKSMFDKFVVLHQFYVTLLLTVLGIFKLQKDIQQLDTNVEVVYYKFFVDSK